MTTAITDTGIHFLRGGGEMGALTRSKKWEETSLGHYSSWPQGLRTTLGIILNSRFPMFLWWGSELSCFYNDAYRPSLGNEGKHPYILGMPAKDAWPEIWDIIKPLIDKVMQEGEAVWFEDRLVPIYRNGKIEDVYWTFSYSPVPGDGGHVAGVLVTCTETTEKVFIQKQLEESERKLRLIISQAPVSIAILRGSGYVVEIANQKALELWGRKEEVMGKPILDAMPELRPQGFQQVLDNVYSTGKRFSAIEMPVQILRKGNLENACIDFSFEALYDELGKIDGIMAVGIDVTDQVMAHKKVEANEERLNTVIKASELGTWELNMITNEVAYSKRYLEIFGYTGDEHLTHAQLVKHLHPDDLPVREKAFKEMFTTGQLHYEARLVWNDGSVHWMEGRGKLFYDIDNKPARLLGTIADITEDKIYQQKLEQSEQRFRNLIAQSPIPMVVFRGPDMVIEIASSSMLKRWKKTEAELLNRKFTDVFPEIKQQKYPALLQEVYKTGRVYKETESHSYLQDEKGVRTFYVDFEYSPLFEADGSVTGIIATVVDVTERVEARQKIEASEQSYRNLIMQSPVAKAILKGKEHVVEMANDVLLKNIWRKEESQAIGKKILDIFPELSEQKHAALLNKVYTTGEKWTESESLISVTGNDGTKDFYIDFEYAPLVEPDKTISGIKITAVDVTEKVQARIKTEESEQKFRLLADSMPQHIWTADASGNLNYYNQSVYDYSGLTPAQLQEGGWIQIVHPDDRDANINEWTKAITEGKEFFFEHRFRKHDGEYRWQLSRAIPQRDADGNIQMWVGTSTDIQDQKTFAGELEKLVKERTSELARNNIELEKMNKELQSFAYISSHDLQEPLRKIQTFSTLLLEKEYEGLSVYGKDLFKRMQKAASRMQTLIDDLLAYSRTNTSERHYELTPLSKLADQVKEDLKEEIKEKQAIIEIKDLPVMKIIPFQFRQLLQNLVGNALKFSSPERQPRITITGSIETGNTDLSAGQSYYHIRIADNGIGFEPQYSDKIFELFQRLHGKEEYRGTGIGLAIVKRIVENHNGIITATGKLNKGASFDIFIPVE